jgi:hypothetical protein
MRATLCALGFWLLSGAAHACLPAKSDKSTEVQTVTTAAGEARGQWCMVATNTTTGQKVWVPRTHACIARLCDTRKALAALARIAASSAPSAQLDAEVLAATVKPAAGSREEYDYRVLHHAVCVKLYDSPPAGGSVVMPTREQACGAQPVYVVRWVVGAPTRSDGTRPTYPWANGVRSTIAAAERAKSGAACNPAIGRVEGSTAWYGVLDRTDRVAVCVRAP